MSELIALSRFRIEKALECYHDAVDDVKNESFASAANRSYYCVFHSMRAVLALDGIEAREHGEIISAFRQRYVGTGIFPEKCTDIIQSASLVMEKCDYKDFYLVTRTEVVREIGEAKAFCDAVNKYIVGLN